MIGLDARLGFYQLLLSELFRGMPNGDFGHLLVEIPRFVCVGSPCAYVSSHLVDASHSGDLRTIGLV
jgi:hypothetical protein